MSLSTSTPCDNFFYVYLEKYKDRSREMSSWARRRNTSKTPKLYDWLGGSMMDPRKLCPLDDFISGRRTCHRHHQPKHTVQTQDKIKQKTFSFFSTILFHFEDMFLQAPISFFRTQVDPKKGNHRGLFPVLLV